MYTYRFLLTEMSELLKHLFLADSTVHNKTPNSCATEIAGLSLHMNSKSVHHPLYLNTKIWISVRGLSVHEATEEKEVFLKI